MCSHSYSKPFIMISGWNMAEQGKILQNPLSLLELEGVQQMEKVMWKKKKGVLMPFCAVTELVFVPASAKETCHRCDLVTDASHSGGQFETVTPDWQMCRALTASRHLISHRSILILKYPKCWALNGTCRGFCQKSYAYSTWQNMLKNNNRFRNFIFTFFLLVQSFLL